MAYGRKFDSYRDAMNLSFVGNRFEFPRRLDERISCFEKRLRFVSCKGESNVRKRSTTLINREVDCCRVS